MSRSPAAFFASLSAELRRLVEEKRTGTLLVTTLDSRLVQAGLENGEIVYLSFQGEEGVEALQLDQPPQTGIGVVRFVPDRFRRSEAPLPPTAAVLELIENARHGVPSRSAMREPTSPSGCLDQTDKLIITQELVEDLGPFAVILCEETWQATDRLDEALVRLTKELRRPGQAAEFKERVFRRMEQER
jgi:hypothetical protein